MSLLADAWLWIWLRVGITVTRVIAPERAAELENELKAAILDRPGDHRSARSTASMSSVDDKADGMGDASTTRRLTSDLVQDDQNTGLHRPSSSTAYMSVGSASSSLDLGDSTNRVSALSSTPSGASDDYRELQLRLDDLKTTTPEMKNLMGLLLRSNEDNAVLKSALLATLAKLQTTREQLQIMKAELHLSQEQAQLLQEERESTCFSVGRMSGIPEEGSEDPEEVGAEMQRSLDTLLAALQDLRTAPPQGETGSKTPGPLASPRSVDQDFVGRVCLDLHSRLCTSSPVSPSSDAAAAHAARQPNLHLKGVGYRVPLTPQNALNASQPDRCTA